MSATPITEDQVKAWRFWLDRDQLPDVSPDEAMRAWKALIDERLALLAVARAAHAAWSAGLLEWDGIDATFAALDARDPEWRTRP